MSYSKPLLVFGTRPEAIKMAPVVHACLARSDALRTTVCVTGQHRELLKQVTDYFGISADIDLNLMSADQSLAAFSSKCLTALDQVLADVAPDCLIVQGDTTTVAMASIAAFYRRVPLVHVEAGLRTGDLQSPWPEEFNRRLASLTTTIHCCPTQAAADNLLAEGVSRDSVHVTGNTVVDALGFTIAREQACEENQHRFAELLRDKTALITCHRRESFGEPLRNIYSAVSNLAKRHAEVSFIYPVHPNPNVRGPVAECLGDHSNVHLIDPLAYPQFVWLMAQSTVILTDSGGVQEEAPTFAKPVVVMRDCTERRELIDAGGAVLTGTDSIKIEQAVSRLLDDESHYRRMQVTQNPYGDGQAAKRIVELLIAS